MILNSWMQILTDAVGINTRNQTRRRQKATVAVAAEMEMLEDRQVMTASPLNIAAAVITHVDHSPKTGANLVNANATSNANANVTQAAIADDADATQVGHVAQARHDGHGKASQVARIKSVSPFVYTAVTLKNTTNSTVNYSFNWNGTAVKSFSLSPGQQRVHYISALNKTGTISFDKSFSSGYQKQTYSLPGRNITRAPGFYLVEPTPSVGEGRLYTFKSVPNGVQLYS